MGGTNAHMILEEAPAPQASSGGRPYELLVVSARTESALDTATARLVSHLETRSDQAFPDVAYTLQVGRQAFGHRRAVVCEDAADAVSTLVALDPRRVRTSPYRGEPCRIAFLFPGQGVQHVGMGRQLYEHEAVFRTALDACCEALRPHLDVDLRAVLYPPAGDREAIEAAGERLLQTAIAQPALFAVEYALAQLWMSWGIEPAACIGHSLGEYVAACLAGVFTLGDALAIVAARGRLMQQLPRGAMTAVPRPAREIEPALTGALALAAVNGPRLSVVAGPLDEVDRFEQAWRERGVECARLHTSHAFHSSMMDAVLEPFAALLGRVKLSAPKLRYVSNVTGTWITAAEATSVRYWTTHLRQTVRFADGVKTLLEGDRPHVLEMGPGGTLGTLARQSGLVDQDAQLVATSLPHAADTTPPERVLLDALGQLWLRGAPVDWDRFHADAARRRVPLPTYPFERQRYWVEPDRAKGGETATVDPLARTADVSKWFYLLGWRRTPPASFYARGQAVSPEATWLIFGDATELSRAVEMEIGRRAGAGRIVSVERGERFEAIGEDRYTIDPLRRDDYITLWRHLNAGGNAPEVVVHLWGAGGRADAADASAAEAAQQLGFYSVIWIGQAAARTRTDPARRLWIKVVTSGVHEVTGQEPLRPEWATVLAPCRVIPQELPFVTCSSVDVVSDDRGRTIDSADLARQIAGELLVHAPDRVVAYRNGLRWSPFFEPVALDGEAGGGVSLRERGVYMIVGGLGAVGSALARHLARTVQARLVLVGRSPLPDRSRWDGWLAAHDAGDATSGRIRTVREIESLGGDVLVVAADAADREQMAGAVQAATERFDRIDGVIAAAGVAGAGRIQSGGGDVAQPVLAAIDAIEPGGADPQFRPKMRGLIVLEDVLGDRPLDFCLIVSSLSAVLGGPGYASYAAANVFMDAFVRRHNQRHAVPWLGANWDAWSFGGADSALAGVTLTEEEGVAAFDRLLAAAGLRQVVISTASLYARIAAGTDARQPSAGPAGEDNARARYARPASLEAPFEEPETELERTVAGIWQAVLGIDRVGRRDNFFALGGHSLMAVQVAARLAHAVQLDIPMRNVFDAATVAELAARIETALGAWQSTPALVGGDGEVAEELEI